uniref:Uncharacterized protein n=1 Tax=virus sp. ctE0n6 TaxID=2827985 RepID=A0A8S5RF08_9VIRU|nr:MAG TPA: hypothetical protein [virus sp. ctE0n6]
MFKNKIIKIWYMLFPHIFNIYLVQLYVPY